MMYRNGEGVEQNYGEAIKWLQNAARGWDDAAYELGVMYEKGIGVRNDIAEAIGWYRNAAGRENEKASARLAKMVEDAYGTNAVTSVVDQHYEDSLILPGGHKIEMIYCPPGEFLMGSPLIEEGREDDEVQHRVKITTGFWLGKYPITQEQWECVMGNNPSFPKGLKCPVNAVSWNDCQEFLRRVNGLAGCQAKLPTEAEWEYACRAGTRTAFQWGNSFDGSQMCCRGYGSSSNNGELPDSPMPVDRYAPNAWGFYDMSGNVSEWCEDWYAEYKGAATDPTGPTSGMQRVLRGGCIEVAVSCCRSAARSKASPDFTALAGLRICCSAE